MKRDHITCIVNPILDVVSSAFGVTVEDMLSRDRPDWTVKARYAALYLLCERHPQLSHRSIQRWWGFQDGFVRYALKAFGSLIETDPSVYSMVDHMRRALDAWYDTHPFDPAALDEELPEVSDWRRLRDPTAIIVGRVAEHYGVPTEKIMSSSIQRDHCAARRVAVYLMALLLPSIKGRDIGNLLGLRIRGDRIGDMVEHVAGHLEVDSSMRIAVDRLRRTLEQELTHLAVDPRVAEFPTQRNVS